MSLAWELMDIDDSIGVAGRGGPGSAWGLTEGGIQGWGQVLGYAMVPVFGPDCIDIHHSW